MAAVKKVGLASDIIPSLEELYAIKNIKMAASRIIEREAWKDDSQVVLDHAIAIEASRRNWKSRTMWDKACRTDWDLIVEDWDLIAEEWFKLKDFWRHRFSCDSPNESEKPGFGRSIILGTQKHETRAPVISTFDGRRVVVTPKRSARHGEVKANSMHPINSFQQSSRLCSQQRMFRWN